jgi:hypothetical protein
MKTLNEFFDKIYVINLARRGDRMAEFNSEFKDLNATRFEGFDHPTNGHCGCTRSHRMLLREIANGDAERVLVFEDDTSAITFDVLKSHGFNPDSKVWKNHCAIFGGYGSLDERFSYLSKFIPDKWDVLYLGAGYGEPPISRYNHHVIRCGFMQTTSSYGITKEFAKIWSDKVDASMGSDDLEKHPGPIDNVFGSMAKDHLYYVLQPRLMYQRKSPSDLTGETHSYLFSMTDVNAEESV